MEDTGFHLFSKGISPKVNVIAGREFKLKDLTVQQRIYFWFR